MNVGLMFHERLSSIAMMNIPIDDQNSLRAMTLTRIMRRDCHISKETKTHRAVVKSVVTRRSYGAE